MNGTGIMILKIFICAVAAYLLGSINSSIIVGRLFGLEDIRKHGSGNAGATNTLRTLGKKAAALTVLGDALKGILAILLARIVGGADVCMYAAGLCVVLGHNFPIYFGFKGGKGILTSAAVIFMLDWRIGLAVLVISLAVMAVSKYVSLGSITGAVLFPVAVFVLHRGDYIFFVFAVIMGLLAVIRHRQNIKRLISGTENKLGSKKAGGANG